MTPGLASSLPKQSIASQRLTPRQNRKNVLFVACGIQKPHVPFLAPDKYFDLYPPNEIVFEPDRPTCGIRFLVSMKDIAKYRGKYKAGWEVIRWNVMKD